MAGMNALQAAPPQQQGRLMAESIDPEQTFVSDVSATAGYDAANDEGLFLRLKFMAKEGIDHCRPRWEEVNGENDLYAGRQWSEQDKRVLEQQLRPAITFNRIGPIIDSLIGLEINNREKVAVFPRKMGEVKESELWGAGIDYVRDNAQAEAEEADAFFDLAVGGEGWTECYLKESMTAPGSYDIGIDRCDPCEMFRDPQAKKRNHRDARYLGRVRSIPFDAAKELFVDGDVTEADLHAGWATYLGDNGPDPSRLPETYLFNAPQNFSGRRENVVIVDIQWWEYAPYYVVVDPFTKQEVHMDQLKFNEAKRRFSLLRPGQKLNSAKYRRRVYKRAFLGRKILKMPQLPCPYDFSFHCMTGKRDKTKRQWFGLVRAMADPQMWANKWLSQIMHILNSNSKGGIVAEKAVFEDWKKVQKNWARPDFIAWLAKGKSPEMVGYRQQANFPQGLFELMNFALQSVPDANGTSSELLGLADRDQPSSLEWQRRQAGMAVLGVFFNALRMYRKQQGRYVLYMMQKWLADGRLIRVTVDAGDQQYVPLVLNKDEGVVEYDMIVDEAPSSPNQKEAVWSMLVQAMPMLSTMQMPPEVWLAILKYSPLPSSLVEQIGQATKPDPNNPQAQEQQQAQARMQDVTLMLMEAQAKDFEAGAEKKKADAVASVAKAKQTAAATKNTHADTLGKLVEATQAITGGGVQAQPVQQRNAAAPPVMVQ